MKLSKLQFFIKNSIDILVVATSLAVASLIVTRVFNEYFFYTITLSFFLAWIINIVIPGDKICNFIARKLHIKENSILGNMVGGLVTNVYLCGLLTIACKILLFAPDINMIITDFINSILLMYIVSYVTYQVCSNLTTYLFNKYNSRKN